MDVADHGSASEVAASLDSAEPRIAAETACDARAFGLPCDLVFVDLETTGGNAAHDRITEVGIVRMQGGEIVEEWSSLVNPECRIPSYIEGFTGITNEMVAGAPRFAEVATLVLEKLQATAGPERPVPIFVAHNARFDYSFLRTEFRRLDMPFAAKVLCTVKLSRRLFPEFPRHSLDAVMERHHLTCSARHRALGDARVLGDFWATLRAEVSEDKLAAAAQLVLGANKLPAYLPAELADELPEGPGVYRFFDQDGLLLYVGRSHSLRTRVLGHFVGDNGEAREQKKARLVRRIDWLETAGDLGAQLKEADWIKVQKPIFNKRAKQAADSATLRIVAGMRGVNLARIADLHPAELTDCFGLFHSTKDARKALTDIARAHSLCLKMLGLEGGDSATPAARAAAGKIGAGPVAARRIATETVAAGAIAAGPIETGPVPAATLAAGNGSCLAHQVGKCKGACVGKESLILHNMRLQLALSALKLKPWPFPGRIALKEGRSEYHVLDHWTYLGTARSEEELRDLAASRAIGGFDVDVYRILMRYLAKNPHVVWHDLRDK